MRSESALIQTMGRAARHVNGHVVMCADEMTGSMRRAIEETYRRRQKQLAYNEAHGITPTGISKGIRDMGARVRAVAEEPATYSTDGSAAAVASVVSIEDTQRRIAQLQAEMREAAKRLEFELAAQLRDEIQRLQRSIA